MTRKTHFRRLPLCLALFAALGAAAWAFSENSSLTGLFQKGKTEFKLASYESSLATFDQLDEMSQKPGYERERAELVPVIAFYRGANLAALGKTEAAEKEYEKYLTAFPNTRLDPGAYPKPVIATFKRVRERVRVGRTGGFEETEIAAAYAQFRPSAENLSLPVDEKWGAGPVRQLMTEDERVRWDRITEAAERAEFVSDFWQKRDPSPATPENEFRGEFERRVLFADARFRIDEKRGSETDRGIVFALLGPPSYVRRFSLTRRDDLSQTARMTPGQVATVGADGRVSTQSVGASSLGGEPVQGTRLVWYYKRDRLPETVKFAEVEFEFISKQDLGMVVLQREPKVLKTLEQAARTVVSAAN